MPAPLEGIRVLEAGFFQNGPQASKILAELGADVVKIEPPVTGDPGRGLAALERNPAYLPYFEAHNRYKRGITLDLRRPEGRDVLCRLVAGADVFLHNFRVGVMERLGLDYESLSQRNPRLVYACVTGLGPEGPERERPVLDAIGQARSGIMDATEGPDGLPTSPGNFGLADQTGAWMIAQGVVAALLARERFGHGQQVEASQFGSMLALQSFAVEKSLAEGANVRKGPRSQVTNPLWERYRGSDGRWFVLGCLQPDRYWPDVCAVIGRPDLERDPRYSDIPARRTNASELVALLDSVFATRPAREWVEAFAAAGVVAGPIQAYLDLPDDPQVRANRYLVNVDHPVLGPTSVVRNPLNFSRTPVRVGAPAPELGQHTEEVLLDAGYTWEQIADLREQAII
jgi:crotonobetainyl-CoA:carnitine CoA-transferase CaiB-like acyl-CoA transferase